MQIRWFVFIFLGLIIVTSNFAQTPFFQHYTLLRKNEAVQVNKILQDHSGLIWYGTNKGLFSFDGINQKRYTIQDSLLDNNVTALAEDLMGRIWIGYKNGSLSIFENGKLKKFDPQEGTSSQPISDILFDSHGILWFSTYNDGLYYYVNSRLYRLDEQEGLPDLFIYDLLEDKNGNVWAGTDGGAIVCKLSEKNVSIDVIDYKKGLPDNIIKKLVLGDDGTIWMATEDAGIVNYNYSTGKLNLLRKDAWKYGSITDFVIKDNTFWISAIRKGLVVYNVKSDHIKFFDNKASEGLAAINTLFKDYEGNIWAGTKLGITKTAGDNLEYIENLGPTQHMSVLALTVDLQDNIWFSTNDGLFRRSIDDDGVVMVAAQLQHTTFGKNRVISLYTDEEGFIWAGLYGEGVLRINPKNGNIKHLNSELRNGNILSITGKGNVIWLATLGGVTRVEIANGKLVVKNMTTTDGLSTDYIYQVFIDSKDRVWFATDGRGVDMMDDKGFHHYEKGLASKVIFGFTEDAHNDIWVNVQGDGIYKIDNSNFVLPKVKLRNNNISCLTTGKYGNLVVFNELGIDIYSEKKNKLISRGEEAGIKNKQANLNALAKDKYGNLFIGTDNGIIKFEGLSFENTVLPKPVIRGLKVLNKNVNLSSDLVFKYDQNSVVIEYSGYWFQNPNNINFRYKLDNYDLDWIDSRDRSATYSSLPPGEYTFRLEVSDSDAFNQSQEAMLKFVVKPPFWRTAIFFILSITSLLLIGYFYMQYRERKLQRDKVILEEKVHERTLEIQRQTEEIQAQNEEILTQAEEIQGINENLEMIVHERTSELEKKNKALEEYAFINAHELRAPVASILGLIDILIRTESEEEAKVVKARLKESAEKLNEVVRSITKAIERGDG